MTFQRFPSFHFMYSARIFLLLHVKFHMVEFIMCFWCNVTSNIVQDFSINFNHMSNIVFIFLGSCFSLGWQNVSSCFVYRGCGSANFFHNICQSTSDISNIS